MHNHALCSPTRSQLFRREQLETREIVRPYIAKPARFQVGGTLLWECIDMGQTHIFWQPWIYTDAVTSIQIIAVGRVEYKLIPQKFYDEAIPEWAAVDILNHRNRVQTPDEVMLSYLNIYVANKLLDVELLQKIAEEYGSAETKADVQTAILLAKGESALNTK
jgi:hypothetical protein